MEIKTKTQLLEFIRKQSLKILKENGAFADLEGKVDFVELEDKVSSVDESFIDVYEKKIEKLKSAEKKAMSDENYTELHKIKQEKVIAFKALVDAYKVKTKILEQIYDGLNKEIESLGTQGSLIFKNKPIDEFSNEELLKGNVIKISTNSSDIKLEKINDNNQYSVLETSANGLQPGDILALPPSIKIGSPAKIAVYRKIEGRFQEIGKPTLQNIKSIIKNPS